MSSFWRWCLPASTLFLLAGPAAAAVSLDGYSSVYIEGIYKSNGETSYAYLDSFVDYSGSSDFRQTGPWGVSGIDSGEYRSGPYRSD